MMLFAAEAQSFRSLGEPNFAMAKHRWPNISIAFVAEEQKTGGVGVSTLSQGRIGRSSHGIGQMPTQDPDEHGY